MSSMVETGLSTSPYPGLRPFRREETDIFFGRDEQVDQLLEKLQHGRFLAVVGASGSGKSSLVRAGLISALEGGLMADAGARWCVAAMRPGERPMSNLTKSLLQSKVLDQMWPDTDQSAAMVKSTLRRGPLGLVELLGVPNAPTRTNLLLLVDQFEEIFRFRRHGDSSEATGFVELLLASAVQRELPVYVVITMRSDFLGDCAVFPGLPEALNDSQYLTPRLTREQCQAAIAGPAAIFGGKIEPRLVNRILNDMGTEPDQLPLMQHALMRAWDKATREQSPDSSGQDPANAAAVQSPAPEIVVRIEDYEAVGRLSEALSNHADEAYQELDSEDRRLAEVLFRCLSDRQDGRRDTRRPVPVSTVAAVAGAPTSQVLSVVEAFRRPDRSFLTPPAGVPLDDDSILDIGHESLIRQWHRMTAWVEAEGDSAAIYRRLLETARLWEQGRAGLWSTPDLDNALAWRKRERPTDAWAERYGGGFDVAMRFIDASVEAQEKLVVQKKRIEAGFVGAFVLVSILAIVALLLWSHAKQAREAAEKAYETAENVFEVFDDTVSVISNPDIVGASKRKEIEDTTTKMENFVEAQGDKPKQRFMLARFNYLLGQIVEEEIASEDALDFYNRSRTLLEQLTDASGDNVPEVTEENEKPLETLGYVVNAIGRVHLKTDREKALAEFITAAKCRKLLLDYEPEDLNYRVTLASSVMNIGVTYKNMGKSTEAEAKYEEAILLLGPDDGDETARPARYKLAQVNYNLANMLISQCNKLDDVEKHAPKGELILDRAKRCVAEVVQIYADLHTEDPNAAEYRYGSLVSSRWLLGDIKAAYADYNQDSEEYKLAIEEYEAAKEELERLKEKEPYSPRYPRSIKSIDRDIAKSKKKLNGEPAR